MKLSIRSGLEWTREKYTCLDSDIKFRFLCFLVKGGIYFVYPLRLLLLCINKMLDFQ